MTAFGALRYEAHRNRETRTHVTVEDGHNGGYDTAAGRWQTICWTHGNIISHATLATAMAFAPHPLEWCDRCGEEQR